MARLPHDLEINGENIHLGSRRKSDGSYIVQLGSQSLEITAGALGTQGFWFHDARGVRHRAYAALQGEDLAVRVDGRTWILESAVHEQGADEGEQDASRIVAPMTGTLISVLVSAGDDVEEGQDLILLSAMKMEHRLSALAAGNIAEVLCEETETVDAGQLLIRLDVSES